MVAFEVAIHTSESNNSIIWTAFDVEVQLLRQLMSGKDNAAKVDDFMGTNNLVVCETRVLSRIFCLGRKLILKNF